MKPLYGTTIVGTEEILFMWLDSKEAAIKQLMIHISINKPNTLLNNYLLSKNIIETYINVNF